MTAKARPAGKKLVLGKPTVLLRSITTDGRLKTVKAQCLLRGKKLTGANKRANCSTNVRTRRATTTSVRVVVRAKCTAGLRFRVKATATAPGQAKGSWKRSWGVKDKPRIRCTLRANG